MTLNGMYRIRYNKSICVPHTVDFPHWNQEVALHCSSNETAGVQDIGSTDLAAAWPKLRQTHSGQLDEGTIPVPLMCAYGVIPSLHVCQKYRCVEYRSVLSIFMLFLEPGNPNMIAESFRFCAHFLFRGLLPCVELSGCKQ